MTKLFALLLTTTIVGLGPAVLAEEHASGQHPDSASYDVTTDPVCKAYDEKSQQSFKTRGTLFATCTQGKSGDFLSCPECIKAVQGKPFDAELVNVLTELMYWQLRGQPGREGMVACTLDRCGIGWERLLAGLHTFAVPGALDFIKSSLDNDVALDPVFAVAQKYYFRNLWWAGARDTTDRILTVLQHQPRHSKYQMHPDNVLTYLAEWGPTAEQHATIESICVDSVLADGYDGADRSKRACARYFAMRPTKNEEAGEYLRLLAGDPYGEAGREAIRAMGMNAKAHKDDLRQLFEVSGFSRETKVGKKKVTTYRAQPSTVAGAIGLLGVGDKTAKGAIAYWLSDRGDGRYLSSNDGWKLTFMGAAFAPDGSWKKLRKQLEKAYKWLAKTKGISDRDRLLAFAAVGLTQAGSTVGMKTVLANIRSPNDQIVQLTLDALGGARSFYGSPDVGWGGVRVGGKRGLKVAEARKLVEALRKRVKFYPKDHLKRAAVLAIYDLEARIVAAGGEV